MTQPVSVLIVDDHTVARAGLRTMLETDDQVRVVGEASDGEEAIARVAELRPRIVLMDIRMPHLDGLEATRRIKASHPSTAVVVMTSYDDSALVLEAITAGAAGYLLKDATAESLRGTVREAADGNVMVSAELMARAMSSVRASRPGDEPPAGALPSTPLTARESRVLELLAEGKTNREIGDTLALAEVTVKKHVQAIMGKLEASDRTQAAITAFRLGLLK